MSKELIARSPDLLKLDRKGYVLEIKAGYLLVHCVPYVTPQQSVKRGTLVVQLNLDGDITSQPTDHTILFAGDFPCNADGTTNEKLRCQDCHQDLGDGIVVRHQFSRKPEGGNYRDYYHMISVYAQEIQKHAQEIDPGATAQTRGLIETEGVHSVFRYQDTASSAYSVTSISRLLEHEVVAIVGLGGTGSYILDLVSKTWVKEVHLFDHDEFQQRNAFRAPGAADVDTLRKRLKKVDYFKSIYDNMKKSITAHDCRIDDVTVEQLKEMTFVFMCIDQAEAKERIIQLLENHDIDFVDVGLGVSIVNDKLQGMVRTTTSTRTTREQARSSITRRQRQIPDEYDQPDIQLAELNSLNACLAVIRWKKMRGLYRDSTGEYDSVYMTPSNTMANRGQVDDDRA